ncbi:MAG: hypothetical protein LBN27_05925 [Prevotellaceae bacterium]|jgi:hypothetical protein|nr:hypothetical protein [Prevotellaceae bacterium]
MATTTTGQWLNQYVAPQLLQEFKNYKDDFIAVLKGVPVAAITADGVRWNKLINNVSFYVNNAAVFTPQSMNGEKVFVEWEKYDTDPTAVTDAEVRYLAYDKRNEVRIKHTEAFKMGIRDHIMWKLAPADNTNANMPVIRTTGEDDGTGRLRLTFEDIVKYLEMVKGLNLPNQDEMYIILAPEHSTDLILDNKSAKFFSDRQIFYDMETGKVRSIMGFKFYENNAVLAYSSAGVKKAKGAVLGATDRRASLMFYAPETVYHLERTKILYKPETEDTRSADPTSEFRIQTYGLVDRRRDVGFGAIVSGIAS